MAEEEGWAIKGDIKSKLKKTNQRLSTTTNSSDFDLNPNLDVDKIPTNDTGTFVDNITVRCFFCRQRFDRPDEYKLHHAEKHAKTYGILPEQVVNSVQEEKNINETAKNSTVSEYNNNSALIRKRRPSCARGVSYVDDDIDTSSSSNSDSSDNDDCDDNKSLENTNIRLNESLNCANDFAEKANHNESVVEPRIKRKKISKKRYSTCSSDSSLECDTDSLKRDIRNTLEKFVKKISKIFMTHSKHKVLKKKVLYTCSKCSLHFLEKSKLFKHLKSEKHTDTQQLQCDYCKLHFTKRSLQKHVKMHIMPNGRLDKNVRFKILTETDCPPDDSSSASEHSKCDNNVKSSVHVSNLDSSKPAEETSKAEQENVKGHVVSKTSQTNSKKHKTILYKCDDCDEHFLSRKNAENHTKHSTHHRIGKNTICNQCTYKFSSPATLSQHERLHHIELNLSKGDFKVFTLTKFGPNRIKSANKFIAKRKVSPESQQKMLNKKHKPINDPINPAMLFKCDGCNQSLSSKQTLLKHVRTCEGKISRKYWCQYCQLYFVTKNTLARHLTVHKKYPQLKKDHFFIISRKPRNQKNTCFPQSNIVSTTEEHFNSSIKKQDCSKTTNVSENDTCKVKLSKRTENCWSVVSNNEKCGEKYSNIIRLESICNNQLHTNKTVAPATPVAQNLNKYNNITDYHDMIVKNNVNIHSTNNLNHESTSINTNVENSHNQNSLLLSDMNVDNILERHVGLVKSAYFEKSHDEKTAESSTDQNSQDERVSYQETSRRLDSEILASGIRAQLILPECCDQNIDCQRIKNESLKEEILENDNVVLETRQNVSNSGYIQITNRFSVNLKFEDSDTRCYQESSSSRLEDESDTESTISPNLQPETKIECDTSTDIKDGIIKPGEINIITAEDKLHNNNHNDDSRDTLMLVEDDDRTDILADDLDDMINVTISSKNHKDRPLSTIPVNSIEQSGKDSINKYYQEKNNTGQTSTLNLVDPSFIMRDHTESNSETRTESQNHNSELQNKIQEKPVSKEQKQSKIQQREQLEVFQLSDVDDADEDLVVVPIAENVEIIDLT